MHYHWHIILFFFFSSCIGVHDKTDDQPKKEPAGEQQGTNTSPKNSPSTESTTSNPAKAEPTDPLADRAEFQAEKKAFEEALNKVRSLYAQAGTKPLAAQVGLTNLGNSCYMNSVLQALVHNPSLNRFFQLSDADLQFTGDNSFTRGFRQFVRTYTDTQNGSFAPTKMRDLRDEFIPYMAGTEQQDASEFLTQVFNLLSQELNAYGTKKPPKRTLPDDEISILSHVETNHFLFSGFSFIDYIFGGFKRVELFCDKDLSQIKYEYFTAVPIDLSNHKNPNLDLTDLLWGVLEDQHFSAGQLTRCAEKEGHKLTRFYKKPGYDTLSSSLVLSLNRFIFNGTEFVKDSREISFPESLSFKDKIYHLYAVVLHSGTQNGGHYTAHVKTADENWYDFNDENVRQIALSDVLKETKRNYILFYHE